METIITTVAVILVIAIGVGIFKLISHPTNQHHYKHRYDDYHRRNFPPF